MDTNTPGTSGPADQTIQTTATTPALTARDAAGLLALGLLGALRREFGLQLSMAALLAAPSLRQQAQLLRGEAAAAAARPS